MRSYVRVKWDEATTTKLQQNNNTGKRLSIVSVLSVVRVVQLWGGITIITGRRTASAGWGASNLVWHGMVLGTASVCLTLREFTVALYWSHFHDFKHSPLSIRTIYFVYPYGTAKNDIMYLDYTVLATKSFQLGLVFMNWNTNLIDSHLSIDTRISVQ